MIREPAGSVVVMDFGIAKVLGGEEQTRTQSGWMGKPKYSSPEQIRQQELDGRADIYSLGMVIYELCIGKQFFAGLNANMAIAQVLDDAQENTPVLPAGIPASFTAIVQKSMAKSREQRYQSMQQLLNELVAYQPGHVEEQEHAAIQEDKTVILQPGVQADTSGPALDQATEFQRRRVRRTQESA